MMQIILGIVKQILFLGGMRISDFSKKERSDLLTAFEKLSSQDVVLLESLVKLVKKYPGRLIIDDTTNPKYGLKQWSRKLKILRTSGYEQGYKIVLFLWEWNGGRIPLGFALWHRETQSLNELALKGIGCLRNQYKLKPEIVLADGAYGVDKLFKRITDYGWPCVMRFRRNRKLSGYGIRQHIPRGYGESEGLLENGVKLKVIRRKDRFYASNRLLWNVKKVLLAYRRRWKVEEVFRGLKTGIGLNGCQQHSIKAQAIYLIVCMLLFASVELDSTVSIFNIRSKAILGFIQPQQLLSEKLFNLF